MGWSIENIKPQLDVIFAGEGKRYSIQHPNALSPRVYLQHEGEITTDAQHSISALFPEFVYIDFFPNMAFGDSLIKLKPIRGRRI